MTFLAWNTPPALADLAAAIEAHTAPLYLIVCLPERSLPVFRPSEQASALETQLQHTIRTQTACLQFNAANALNHILPGVHLWLMPSEHAARLADYFAEPIAWQTEAVPQTPSTPPKPWYAAPARHSKPEHVIVLGAGIAGAACARELAEHGVSVTLLEAAAPAQAASGNRQGLLYAKISAHNTEQTELLLCGYGHSRRLLQKLLPDQASWGGDGVLHLNHDAAEHKRNQALGRQTHHRHLYRSVDAAEAAALAGIPLFTDSFPPHDSGEVGLYWPQGVWLNPPALITALLNHPLIELHTRSPALSAHHDGRQWHVDTPSERFSGSHLIYCLGAQSPAAPDRNIAALPYQLIRGQTSLAAATAESEKLRCALSGASYISPAWQGLHCFGASFVHHDNATDWREAEERANRHELAALNPVLATELCADNQPAPQGHAALRCDSPDHLPLVGPLADIAAMQQVYAKLALDKNYRLNAPCPYLPNAYINTAHGSRGLATAPICAAAITADILGLPNPLSPRIRAALHPNRTIIRGLIKQQPLLEIE